MPAEITMPQLSDTMTEGTVVKWLKKEGDKVKSGDIIAEIETDKANMEMESFDSGTLALLAAKEGEKVKVGDRIAVLATGGENPGEIKNQFAGAAKKSAGAPAPAPAPAPVAAGTGQPPPESASSADAEMGAAPIERGRAQARERQTGTSAGTTPESMSRAADAAGAGRQRAGNGSGTRVRVSPLARRLAEERGIDLNEITGTGPAGRITQRDVEAAAEAPQTTKEARAPERALSKAHGPAVGLTPRVATGQKQVIPLTKMRATIAQRLQQSKQQIPHFYTTVDVDVELISEMRGRLNKQLAAGDVKLSLGDFVAKGVAQALLVHPQANAHLVANEITRFGDVHLGMAVALPDGLIVPVLRSINQMGLREIRQRSEDLVERARAGRLKQDELSGATFTVSNLGMYGVRDFSAIINPPEVGILAVSAAERRPVVRGDAIVPRTTMCLTLSADHRAVDGATAAEFLRTLRGLLEEPGMMLV
jgi:pyruvate dehydrogenase E2 component (dihydrolipoamide acetyltransferase)